MAYYISAIGDQPNLIELIRFRGQERRSNIPQEISTKYRQFGILLLKDVNGARVTAMAHKHRENAEQINIEILQEWIMGNGVQPVTWAILVEILEDIGMTVLASDIRAVKS